MESERRGESGGADTGVAAAEAPPTPAVTAPPTAPGLIRPPPRVGTVWPVRMGLALMLIGAGGAAWSAWSLTFSRSARFRLAGVLNAWERWGLLLQLIEWLTLGAGVWAVVAGIGVTARRRWGAAAATSWAWSRAGLVLAWLAAGWGHDRSLAGLGGAAGTESWELGLWPMVVVVAAWHGAVSVFVLRWFRRVRGEVLGWGGGRGRPG